MRNDLDPINFEPGVYEEDSPLKAQGYYTNSGNVRSEARQEATEAKSHAIMLPGAPRARA